MKKVIIIGDKNPGLGKTLESNISDVSDSVSREDKLLIDGSGLFFFKSRLPDDEKLEIVNWYKSLPPAHREFVDIIRGEAIDEAALFSNYESL